MELERRVQPGGRIGKRRTRGLAVLGGALLFTTGITNCGGRSSRVDGDSKDGAGTSSSGATATGGAAGSAVGGSGGSVIEPRCREPLDRGPCTAFEPSFWFDATTGVCFPFDYGGCEGNANHFPSAEECYRECGGQGVQDLPYCSVSADCRTARIAEPCCSTELREFVGINIRTTLPPCQNSPLGCNNCAAGCSTVPQDGYIGARCVDHHCIAYDYQSLSIGCESRNDCTIRFGTDCCPDCRPELYPSKLVGLSRNFDIEAIACDGGVSCPDNCDYAERIPWCSGGVCSAMTLVQ